jgi:hypothetical protein
MSLAFTRRVFLGLVPVVPFGVSLQSVAPPPIPHARFPAQEDDAVREVVGASHNNLARVKDLVMSRPALARAGWDWGFGDWETAIDAASHVGNKPIVEFLLGNGARPTLFTAVMLGQMATVKAMLAAWPGYQRVRGPHGLTMMVHARAGGDGNAEMVKYLESLGDADPQYPNLPLTDAEQAAILGDYSFGPGPSDRFKVGRGSRWLTIERAGSSSRNLFHQGGLIFIPAGAEAVRIRFDGRSVTLSDGPTTWVANRL